MLDILRKEQQNGLDNKRRRKEKCNEQKVEEEKKQRNVEIHAHECFAARALIFFS